MPLGRPDVSQRAAEPAPGASVPLCNFDRLLAHMRRAQLPGIVVYYAPHVFYLSGFLSAAGSGRFEASSEACVVLSLDAPDHPILIVVDSQLGGTLQRQSWISDVRAHRGVMHQLDRDAGTHEVDNYLPRSALETGRAEPIRKTYAHNLDSAVIAALRELRLTSGRVAFDHPWLAARIAAKIDIETIDAYGLLRSVRAVKTPGEIARLERAARVNEEALNSAIGCWRPGATCEDIGRAYQHAVIDLGGRSGDPHPFVVANPPDGDPAFLTFSGTLDYELERGQHIMFDCHGKCDEYCWDGGKTWIVGGDSTSAERHVAQACAEAVRAIEARIRPGTDRRTLQQLGRNVLRAQGIADADAALIFFHGLGLDHGDIEIPAQPSTVDWRLEAGMVVSVHFFLPGDVRSRYWLEDIVLVGERDCRSLYSWGLGPHA